MYSLLWPLVASFKHASSSPSASRLCARACSALMPPVCISNLAMLSCLGLLWRQAAAGIGTASHTEGVGSWAAAIWAKRAYSVDGVEWDVVAAAGGGRVLTYGHLCAAPPLPKHRIPHTTHLPMPRCRHLPAILPGCPDYLPALQRGTPPTTTCHFWCRLPHYLWTFYPASCLPTHLLPTTFPPTTIPLDLHNIPFGKDVVRMTRHLGQYDMAQHSLAGANWQAQHYDNIL